MKFKKDAPYKVEWVDIVAHISKGRNTIKQLEGELMESYGVIFSYDDKYLKLLMSVDLGGTHGEEEEGSSDVIIIPTGCITSVAELQAKRKKKRISLNS